MRSLDTFKRVNLKNKKDYSYLIVKVDIRSKGRFKSNCNSIIKNFKPNIYFSWSQILKVTQSNKRKFNSNIKIIRNEGPQMTKTQKLWRRAKQIIPGGNMLLSKRPELFFQINGPRTLPNLKNCSVWDLDFKKYLDISLMGVGTNTLGYAHKAVDSAVRGVIKKRKFNNIKLSRGGFVE